MERARVTDLAAAERFSAGPALALGFGGAAALLAGVLGWSVLASVSGAVIASGVIAVENRNQTVEHIDGGTVREILVRDGDRVERDQVLLRFADGELRSEEAILAAQYAELAARQNRLEAEFRGLDAIAWDRELTELAATDPEVADILAGQERLFRAREAARQGEIARLRERIGQTGDEIAGLEAQGTSLREQSALIARELEAQRSLFEQGLTRLSPVLALERAARNLEGQSGSTRAGIARARGGIAELEAWILQIDANRIEAAEDEARDVSARAIQVKERLASVRAQLGRMEVRAPVAGEVFGMSVFAPREVVLPGEPILQIVPLDGALVAMARLDPTDVDQVYPGQPAVLRFPAFPARQTPEFDGSVVRISPDTLRDEATGRSWYEVELAVRDPRGAAADGSGAGDGRASLPRRFAGLAITPGMPVEAHIRTGERTVLDILAKPVTDFFYRSLREE